MLSMATDKKLIHEVLNTWLEEAHLSQADIARITNHTTGGISMVFTGRRRPSPSLLVEIAEACGKPREDALRLVRLLAPIAPVKQKAQELEYVVSKLPEPALDDVLEFARHRLSLAEKRGEYVIKKSKGV
jgi:transcriptional regulator with XRE-family HTH domain